MELEAGTVLEGKVTGITKFGAFVALPEGKSGLVHISEVADTFVNDVNEFLKVGQELKVRVLSVADDGKIRLSARNVSGEARPVAQPRQMCPAVPAPRSAASAPRSDAAGQQIVKEDSGNREFEDKLKQFMQEADSRMSGNKLYEQQRRSRSRRK